MRGTGEGQERVGEERRERDKQERDLLFPPCKDERERGRGGKKGDDGAPQSACQGAMDGENGQDDGDGASGKSRLGPRKGSGRAEVSAVVSVGDGRWWECSSERARRKRSDRTGVGGGVNVRRELGAMHPPAAGLRLRSGASATGQRCQLSGPAAGPGKPLPSLDMQPASGRLGQPHPPTPAHTPLLADLLRLFVQPPRPEPSTIHLRTVYCTVLGLPLPLHKVTTWKVWYG